MRPESYVIRRPGDRVWRVLVTLYIGALLSANAMAAKLVDVFGIAAVTVGALAIPLVYTATDLLNELYGKHCTRQVVFMGFGANLVLVGYSLLFAMVPAAPVGASQAAFMAMFGITWRVVLGSQVAYLASSMLDVEVFDRVRAMTKDRHLWLRQSVAVLIAQAADSMIFTVLAFAFAPGVPLKVLPLIAVTEYVTKIVVSPLRTVISYYVLRRIRSRK